MNRTTFSATFFPRGGAFSMHLSRESARLKGLTYHKKRIQFLLKVLDNLLAVSCHIIAVDMTATARVTEFTK